MAYVDPVADAVLFDIEQPPPVSLADKFGLPPMSVLDRRSGDWQDRRARWLSLGIRSELGRDAPCGFDSRHQANPFARFLHGTERSDGTKRPELPAVEAAGTSVFDPVLCELVYRWFSPVGGRVLDPFAGGSVRGLVASTLARYYVGIDLRPEQVAANYEQAHLGSGIAPRWIVGDATSPGDDVGSDYDLVFSCPPYVGLERYSDDPADLSTMAYPAFRVAHATAIREAAKRLRRDRFLAWVISDVRSSSGAYHGVVADTITDARIAGLTLHNDAIIVAPINNASLRAERPFVATRKLTRVHQHLLVFVKGDARAATQAVS